MNFLVETLFLKNIQQLAQLFQQHLMIEISRDAIIVHQ